MAKTGVVIPKTWRSELNRTILFFILLVLSIAFSRWYPGSVITGELISFRGHQLMLSLPLFWLIPACSLGNVLMRIYNVRYVVDGRGIETRVGILAMNQRISRVRYQDIRSVETEQTVIERALDIGKVFIGTAATGAIEIVFDGIAAPKEVQDMIQRERDRRQKFSHSKPQAPTQRASNVE